MEASGGHHVQPHHPYRVTAQRQTQQLTNAGHFEDVHEVHFVGPSNVAGVVRIPSHQYTPAHVDQQIQAHLDNIEGVHALGPLPHPDNAA